MATTITRTPWIDDDGSGTTGTVLNNAIKTELYNQIDTALGATDTANLPGVSVVATGGAITSLPIPSGTGDLVIFLTHATGGTIQGITNGINGQRVTIYVLGMGTFSVAHLSGTCPATHRCVHVAASAPTSIAGEGGSVQYVYETSTNVWRMVAHEQGGWITVPFNAANFSGSGGTWTVAAGNRVSSAYRLSGKTLTYGAVINSTTVGGTPSGLLINNPEYGNFTAARQFLSPFTAIDPTGGMQTGYVNVSGGGAANLSLVRYGGNWTASAAGTSLYLVYSFEVQ